MTATVANDCSSIAVTSTYLHNTNISSTLKVSANGATSISIEIAPATSHTLIPSDLSVTAFSEGVYTIELDTVQSDHSTSTEVVCALVICSLGCDIVPLYSDVANIDKILAYEALKGSLNCTNCDCSKLQVLYNLLTDTPNANDCGCQ